MDDINGSDLNIINNITNDQEIGVRNDETFQNVDNKNVKRESNDQQEDMLSDNVKNVPNVLDSIKTLSHMIDKNSCLNEVETNVGDEAIKTSDDISSDIMTDDKEASNDLSDTSNVEHTENQNISASDDEKPLSEILQTIIGRKRKYDDADTTDDGSQITVKKECIDGLNIYKYKCRWPGKGQCHICGDSFYTRRNAIRHMNLKHARDLMFQCKYCSYRVRLKDRLTRHVASVHNKDYMYTSDVAIPKDPNISNVKIKNESPNIPQAYKKCYYCFYETTNSKMRLHITSLHQVKHKPHYCIYCNFTTDLLQELQEHLSVHNDLKCYSCEFCVYRTIRKSYLRRHIRNSHKNVQKVFTIDEYDDDEDFVCSQCDYSTVSQKKLFKHIIRKHQKNWTVTVTKEEPDNECKDTNLTEQISTIKPVEVQKTEQQKRFYCSKCNFVTLYESLYNEHMASVHVKVNDVQWFNCTYCDFTSIYSHSLKRHYETLHFKIRRNRIPDDKPKEKFFECDYCNLITQKKIQIRRHVENQHDIDRPFNCTLCDYKSSKRDGLKLHMRLHS